VDKTILPDILGKFKFGFGFPKINNPPSGYAQRRIMAVKELKRQRQLSSEGMIHPELHVYLRTKEE
jgi:hypothetical protein